MKLINKYSSTVHGHYKKMSLLYGFVTSLVMSAVLTVRYLNFNPPSSPLSFADNIAMLLCLIILTYIYRSKLEDGKMTFKEGFLVAFYAGIVASILYGMFMYLYSASIDTQMSERCIRNLRTIPDYASYTDEQFSAMSSPSALALQSIIYNIVMAILWAFLTGIILRNEKSEIVVKNKKR